MNYFSKLSVIVLAMLVSACATDPTVTRHVLDANARIAAQPTLTIRCETGCSASYTDPRDRQAVMKLPTNGWDAVVSVGNSVTSVIQSAVVPMVLGNVAVQGFKALQNSGAVTTSTVYGANSGAGSGVTTTSTTTNNTTSSSLVGANSGAGSGNTNNPVTTTTTANPVTTTTTSTANPVTTTTSTTTSNPVTTTTTAPSNSGNTNTGSTGSGNTN